MIRLLILALLLVPLADVNAQRVCTPACAIGYHCAQDYQGRNSCVKDAQCIGDNCEVEEIVVPGTRPTPPPAPAPTPPASSGKTFKDLVEGPRGIVDFIDSFVIPVLYALAFVAFLFGILRYFFTANEEKRKEGRAVAIWGIVGLVLLFSIWGVVRLLLSFIGA